MHLSTLRFFLFISCLCKCAQASTQSNIIPPERVYIQTDKPYYTAEDTIWFSSILFNSQLNGDKPFSKGVWVELINHKDSIISTKRIFHNHHSGSGDFIIPTKARGNFMIRAYTQVMRNFSDSYFYYQEIPIVDIENSDEFSQNPLRVVTNEIPDNLHVIIKPESGGLVYGIKNQLYVKVENIKGEVVACKGTLFNEEGNAVANLTTFDFGIGSINFIPKAGSKYFLQIENSAGTHPLMHDDSVDYNIGVVNRGSKMLVSVGRSEDQNFGDLFLVGSFKGRIIFQQNILVEDHQRIFTTSISTEEIDQGRIIFAVLDKEGRVLAKRASFNHYKRQDESSVTISANKDTFSTKSPLDITVTTNLDSVEILLFANHKNSIHWNQSINTFTSFYHLPEPMRGVQKSYFFRKDIPLSRKIFLLDAAMTLYAENEQNAEYQNNLAAIKNLEFPIEEGIFLKGKTTTIKRPDQGIKSNVWLNFLTENITNLQTTTVEDGVFEFGPLLFQGEIDAVIQARKFSEEAYDKKGKIKGSKDLAIHLVEMTFVSPPVNRPPFRRYDHQGTQLPESYLIEEAKIEFYEEQYRNLLTYDLDEVTILSRRVTTDNQERMMDKATAIYSDPSARMVLSEQPGIYYSIFDLLSRMPGVLVTGSPPLQNVAIGPPGSFLAGTSPSFYLDNFPIDQNSLYSVSPNDIWFVDVIKGGNASIFGINGANGVIAVYTKSGQGVTLEEKEGNNGIIKAKVEGYYKNRPFNIPDYSVPPTVIRPDIRNTLFWKPSIRLSQHSSQSMTLSSSDIEGTYEVKVMGLDGKGSPIMEAIYIQINN